MKKILIFSAPFGNGHNSVSKALEEQLKIKYLEKVEIVCEDLFTVISPNYKKIFVNTYKFLTEIPISMLYNELYNLRDNEKNIIDDVVVKLSYNKFVDYINKVNPDVIISVFPTAAQFSSFYKESFNPFVKTVTVITDVVSSLEWYAKKTDLYLVPSIEVKNSLVSNGVDDKNICISGIPVRKQFDVINEKECDNDRKKVLIMLSSMSKFNIDDMFLNKLSKYEETEFILVTGKDEKLYRRLKNLETKNIKILEYIENISEYMKKAEFIVTKPGGATTFEAIYMNLPLVLIESNIGQENKNIEFVRRNKLGKVVKNEENFFEIIKELLENKEIINGIKNNMDILKLSMSIEEAIERIYSL